MKKRLSIKIEEVKIDKKIPLGGMFGGPCGGGIVGGSQAAQNAANMASAMGIGNIGSIANNGTTMAGTPEGSFNGGYTHPGAQIVLAAAVGGLIAGKGTFPASIGPVIGSCLGCHPQP